MSPGACPSRPLSRSRGIHLAALLSPSYYRLSSSAGSPTRVLTVIATASEYDGSDVYFLPVSASVVVATTIDGVCVALFNDDVI